MASPAGGKRTVSATPVTNLGLQAGSTFPVKAGENGPQDNARVVGLSTAGGTGTFGGAAVTMSPGYVGTTPPNSSNGSTMTSGGTTPLKTPTGDQPDAPKVPVTSSGGSKSKR